MNLRRRLHRLETAADPELLKLHLDDGRVVRLERASDIRLMTKLIDAQATAYEAGIDPRVELFARSLPRTGEGTLRASVRHYCWQLLGLPVEGWPPFIL